MSTHARLIALVLFAACKRHREEDLITFPPPPDPPPASSVSEVASATSSAAASDAHDAGDPPMAMLGIIGDAGMPWGREDLDASDIAQALGGTGEGIGLGNIGTIGHGRASPHLRQGVTTVNGRLPPEVIQRIVRQNFGRFRVCYEEGLKRDPTLRGTVATKFVIDRSGNVINTSRDASTTLADPLVVSCITRVFTTMAFPQPEGGIVTVIYPVIMDPS